MWICLMLPVSRAHQYQTDLLLYLLLALIHTDPLEEIATIIYRHGSIMKYLTPVYKFTWKTPSVISVLSSLGSPIPYITCVVQTWLYIYTTSRHYTCDLESVIKTCKPHRSSFPLISSIHFSWRLSSLFLISVNFNKDNTILWIVR